MRHLISNRFEEGRRIISGKILRAPELEKLLGYIQRKSRELDLGPGLAALTCDDRNKWAKVSFIV